MVVIIKRDAPEERLEAFLGWARDMGCEAQLFHRDGAAVVGLAGDTAALDINLVRGVSIVEDAHRISEPYKNASRTLHPQDTVVRAGCGSAAAVGGGAFTVIAGPCSVEGREPLLEVARRVQAAGAGMLRGGAFKPRTSPYAFQGMGAEAVALLAEARAATGLPIVCELLSTAHLPLYEPVDVLQVGARNMQNFELLKALGRLDKPILLKRSPAATVEELLLSAEYILAGGNSRVILCERGIRTFETATRSTLDISAIPLLKAKSHLPVVVDPSHAAGTAWMVPALAKAALAAGADGLLIEVHGDPEHALCDGNQALRPEAFAALMDELRPMAALLGKTLSGGEGTLP